MRKLSRMLSDARLFDPYFPVAGDNRYAGEQDGSHVYFSDVYEVASKAEADQLFPNGVPDHVKVHWADYTPGAGWQFVLGCWSNRCPAEWTWPTA